MFGEFVPKLTKQSVVEKTYGNDGNSQNSIKCT